jgi:hypothetical protein
METKKQTAVEWLAEQMMHPQIHNPYIDQAKAMEKEQIIEAATWGALHESAQQYYNETYNS